jgi:hypothetical protein
MIFTETKALKKGILYCYYSIQIRTESTQWVAFTLDPICLKAAAKNRVQSSL